QALLEIVKRTTRQQIPNLSRNRRLQRLLQNRPDRSHQAFTDLQRHVSDEPVAHHHVSSAVIQVSAFDVSNEIQMSVFQQLVSFAGKVVALAFFFAYRKQPNSWTVG